MHEFRRAGVFGLVWLAVGVGCAYAAGGEVKSSKAETVVIPLSEVAGLGRKGLNNLEPDLLIYRDTPEKIARYSTPEGLEEMKRLSTKSLVRQIKRAFYEMSRNKKSKAGKGFAVSGRNRDALPKLYRVAVNGETPKEIFSAGKEISLVFFSYPATPVVRIESIERTGAIVNISYSIYPQGRQILRSKLLLIPCGKLPIGNYQVNMHRLPANKTSGFTENLSPVLEELENRIVCKPFSFTVSDVPHQSPNVANGNATTQERSNIND